MWIMWNTTLTKKIFPVVWKQCPTRRDVFCLHHCVWGDFSSVGHFKTPTREYGNRMHQHLPGHLDLSSFLSVTSKLQLMMPSPKQAIIQHSSFQSRLHCSSSIFRNSAPMLTPKETLKLSKHSFERMSLVAQVWRKCSCQWPWVMVDARLNTRQLCTIMANKGNPALEYIRKSITTIYSVVIFIALCSGLVRLHSNTESIFLYSTSRRMWRRQWQSSRDLYRWHGFSARRGWRRSNGLVCQKK